MAKIHFKPTLIPEQFSKVQNIENLWGRWSWQLQNSIHSLEQFQRYFKLSSAEQACFKNSFNEKKIFNIQSTPYYASLAKDLESDPIRQIIVPHPMEMETGVQQMLDPLGERKNNPVPRIIHRYSDRALFLVTDTCSVYCRYCTRKHFTGFEQAFVKDDEYQKALSYLRQKPGIREVILSGGDPLTLSDTKLDRVLGDLRQIAHIEIIRVGSRMPVVCPMRITKDLIQVLKTHKPVFLMTHFNHPQELSLEAAQALEEFVDNGIPVFNQMVLLNGINNHPAIVQALSRRLLYLRVKPYYMFQCDPSMGTDHLRTSLSDSMEIQRELWGHLSGLALPNLSLDIPDGGGKTYYVPNFETHRQGHEIFYRGWDGVEASYINPADEKIRKPLVQDTYLNEWQEIRSN